MSRIIGPASGKATIQGTSDDDVIIAAGAGNTILGGGGNDVISAGRFGGAKVFVGSTLDGLTGLHPVVRLCGADNALFGGDESFTVVGYGPGTKLDLGNGDNTVTAYGAGNDITVGIGRNTVTAGPGSSVLVRSPDPGVLNVEYADTIRFSGTGNRLTVDAYGQKYPLNGTLDVSGGNGSGTFDMQWANGTLVTYGRDNVVSAGIGTVDISPGNGGSQVHLPGIFQRGGNATVRLAGDHDTVDGLVDSARIVGGTGYADVDLEGGIDNTTAELALGGEHNSVRLLGFGNAVVDAGSGHATVSLAFCAAQVAVRGADNRVLVGGGPVTIQDRSDGLLVELVLGDGLVTIEDFGVRRGGVVQIDDGSFASAQDAAAAVRSDGAGGSVLRFQGGGFVEFAGVTGLTADNFRIAPFDG